MPADEEKIDTDIFRDPQTIKSSTGTQREKKEKKARAAGERRRTCELRRHAGRPSTYNLTEAEGGLKKGVRLSGPAHGLKTATQTERERNGDDREEEKKQEQPNPCALIWWMAAVAASTRFVPVPGLVRKGW